MRSQSVFACLPALAPQCLFLNFDKQTCLPVLGAGHGDIDEIEGAAVETTLPAPREVLPCEVDPYTTFATEPVVFQGGYSLLKGRVGAENYSTLSASLMSKAGVAPGKYEGGLKLWECTIDLVNTMRREIKDGQLSFRGKRVLELGCGYGLPGIFAMLKGATTVHFQDFNDEVLYSATIPNVVANLEQARLKSLAGNGIVSSTKSGQLAPDVHYYAGDWQDVHELLSVAGPEDQQQQEELQHQSSDSGSEEESPPLQQVLPLVGDGEEGRLGGPMRPLRRKKSNSSRAFERALMDVPEGGYDIILMSETVYSLLSLPKLYALIKKCLRPPYGVLYVAAKKNYFGVGGGARQFKAVVDEDGILGGHLVTEFSENSSNVREVWKFFYR